MVKLRLKRIGKKFSAFYRIVAADSRAPRDGRFIEEIGYYNPHSKELFIDVELQKKWLSYGAQPSPTVKTLFKQYDQTKAEKAVSKKETAKKNCF
ncbi:30S ribosomal protein S16 [Mycoplasma sp. ATU-Cv-508]|uniref:30S ribosomal protein S16 n=1 Tax=Mycoplasma sp. ATU-Cv-508 TaxID=2048001 RepID=UPI000FDD9509